MIFDKVGTTTIVSQENISLPDFLQNLEKGYAKVSKDNIIINLFSFSKLSSGDILEFLSLSESHVKKNNKSFVLVTKKIPYDDVPDSITVVPTLQEAHDIIEMEEIERDLGI